ncbi:MAG: hypothetical protein JW953_09155 [Anaerolineae bacterium]|nr:hypothetical protein [Anaerolineae bacterium]
MNSEDTLSVLVNYRNGASLTYLLHVFMPWEGYVIAFNGSKGRLEHTMQETVYISGDGSVADGTRIKIMPHFQPGYEMPVDKNGGGHGGADPVRLQDLFNPQGVDKYQRAADCRSGAWSILTGIAGNHALAQKRAIRIDELIRDLAEPDYPPMPKPTEAMDPLPLKRSTAVRG